MLELLYTSNKTVYLTDTRSYAVHQLVYLSTWDALLLNNGGNRLDKLFRDGSQAVVGQSFSYWGLGSRVNARAFWMNYYGNDPTTMYAADDITGIYSPGNVLTPWAVPASLKDPGNFVDDWAGIYLHNNNYGYLGLYQLSDGVALGSIKLNSSDRYNSISYVGRGKVLVFQKATGKVALVDYLNQIVLWQSKVRPALVCAYDTRHDLVVTVESDLKVRVYLTTPLPATLGAPEFYPAPAHVTRKGGYQVRARLLGDANEPCPGYWVSWDFVNIPAMGYLQKAMSETDQDGYAWNYYFGPATATGQETIRAEVTI